MSEAVRYPSLIIKDPATARVGRGHSWVFSNDVLRLEGEVAQGAEVAVRSNAGEFYGTALYNKHALITARIFSRKSEPFTEEMIRARIADAADRRKRQFTDRNAWRLIFSDSDGLPGLVVDQYDNVLSAQFLTLAMDQRKDLVVKILKDVINPIAIVERSDAPARLNEGLEEIKGVLFGEIPEDLVVTLYGLKFRVDPLDGQKTGMYLDQVENWNLMKVYAPGKKVLDLFSHIGGFSLNAAKAGATFVKAVDSSDSALSQLMFNAVRNGLDGQIKAKKGDAFQYVRAMPEMYDVIVCDPPPFARSKKQLETALRGYRELNRHCLKMLNPGGVLISASCSAAVGEADFDKMLSLAAKDAKRQIRVLPGGGQPADHAPLISMPETHYLKIRIVEAVD
ncbi:class I SAM-dependent rRNA methyltransferase [soil metagenome]